MIAVGCPSEMVPAKLTNGKLYSLPRGSASVQQTRDAFFRLLDQYPTHARTLLRALKKGWISGFNPSATLTIVLRYGLEYYPRVFDDSVFSDAELLDSLKRIAGIIEGESDTPFSEDVLIRVFELLPESDRSRHDEADFRDADVQDVEWAAGEIEYGQTPESSVAVALFAAWTLLWIRQQLWELGAAQTHQSRPRRHNIPEGQLSLWPSDAPPTNSDSTRFSTGR